MKKIYILAAAAALSSLPAVASDLPTKAPNFSLGTYPTMNGLIVGVFTEGGGSSVTATAPGVPAASLTTTTASIGATVGYMFTPRGNNISYSVEADVSARNFNGNNAGFALSGPLSFEQRVMVYAPWQKLLAALPSFPNPFSGISAFTLPSGVAPAGAPLAGIGFGFYEQDISTAFAGVKSGNVWRANPELVFMNVQQLNNGAALRGWIKVDFNSGSKILGTVPGGLTTATLGATGVRAGVGAAF